jgi:ribosomal protein S12 methylthiotransferase
MKVNLISLGCAKNLVDSEKIIGALGASGIAISASPRDSDVIIINTCGFIKPALQETEDEIKKVLMLANGSKKVYVLGCAVNRFGPFLKDKYPEVSAWFKLNEEKKLLHSVNKTAVNIRARLITTHGYAYLKIGEGCSNHCSYCTIPSIKGEYRSFDFGDIIKEAEELSKLGTKEIILIAQDTTRYGLDTYGKPMLVPLVKELSKIRNIQWIRILYAHPKGINEKIIRQISSNKKVCKYLDIPIQHINDRILRLMNRGIQRKKIELVIARLKKIKGVSLRTSIITGFATESDEEFNELVAFLDQGHFTWFGVFPYFCEQGTPAARLKQLPTDTIEKRYRKLVRLQKRKIKLMNIERIGKTYKTLIHSQNGYYKGHSQFESPEIDGEILTKSKKINVGKFYNLKIRSVRGFDCYGTID